MDLCIFVHDLNLELLKRIIKINQKSALPKYRQIIDSLYSAIDKGTLKTGDKVPSINQISKEFNLSRDTVLSAFNELKSKGVLTSLPGKGYYLTPSGSFREEKVFVMLDEFNAFKEDFYNALIHSLEGKAHVEIFFHHFNLKKFRNIIKECAGRYSSYIILPTGTDEVKNILSLLPSEKVFILDRFMPELNCYRTLYQDFENDIYEAMGNGLSLLKKYLKLVYLDSDVHQPAERLGGFIKFCNDNKIKYEVVKSIHENRPNLYEAWFVTKDCEMVQLIKIAKKYKYKLGKKFGIVSFNNCLLKEVAAGGITTISTDFKKMGNNLANMIFDTEVRKIKNPSRLIVRKSL